MSRLKGLLKVVFGRTTMVIVSLLAQIIIFVISCEWLSDYTVAMYTAFTLLGAVVVIYIINENVNSSFKLAWIIPVLVIPVFGTLLYLFVNLQIGTKYINNKIKDTSEQMKPYLNQEQNVIEELSQIDKNEVGLANYMNHSAGFPTYHNSSVKYFPIGEDKFAQLLIELEKAEKYIFLEYFIIAKGYMWNTILEILKRKVADGVEVRVMYDGMCSLMLLPYKYPEELARYGIKCKMFSPIKPILSTHQNNRDHRKILVIDGHTAFTGGINLADEYINREVRFGHWKDTAVMIKGEAVKSFTMMFFQIWNITEHNPENYEKYLLELDKQQGVGCNTDITDAGGFVIPYGDNPYDDENVGKQVYIDVLNRARKYVHIMTPYLILDDEMVEALTYAAKRGVETIIIMPHMPDKLYAYLLARTYYAELLVKGVKIYEYTPGFVHAKVFVSDDEKAVVGTVNLDFRSLYLHFECGMYLYHNKEVLTIEQDYQDTLLKCQEMTIEDCKKLAPIKRFAGQVLRLFAPLM